MITSDPIAHGGVEIVKVEIPAEGGGAISVEEYHATAAEAAQIQVVAGACYIFDLYIAV